MSEFDTGYTLEEALGCVREGWKPLIRELWTHKPDGIRVNTVKEKFGGLRVYFDADVGVDYNKFEDAVDEVEEKSQFVCEECGKPGTIEPMNMWYKCLCEEHKASYGNR